MSEHDTASETTDGEQTISLQALREATEQNVYRTKSLDLGYSLTALLLCQNRRLCGYLLRIKDELHDTYYYLQQKLDSNYDTVYSREQRVINQCIEHKRSRTCHTTHIASFSDDHTVVIAKLMDSVTEARENLRKALRDCTKYAIPSKEESKIMHPGDESPHSRSQSLQPQCAAGSRKQVLDLSTLDFSIGGAKERATATWIVNDVETRFSSAVAELISSQHNWSCERIQSKELARLELLQSTDSKVASMSAKILGPQSVEMYGSDGCMARNDDLQKSYILGSATAALGWKKQRETRQCGFTHQKCMIESCVLKAHGRNVQLMATLEKIATSTATEYLWLRAAVTRLRHDLAIATCNCRIALMCAAVEVASIEKISTREDSCVYLICTRFDQKSSDPVAGTRRQDEDKMNVDASRETCDYIDLQTQMRRSATIKLASINKSFQKVRGDVDRGVIRAHNFGCRLSDGASSIARLLVAAVAELRTVPVSFSDKANMNRDEAALFVSRVGVNPKHAKSHNLHNAKAITSQLPCNNVEPENRLPLLCNLLKCVHAYRMSVRHLINMSYALHSSTLEVWRCGRKGKSASRLRSRKRWLPKLRSDDNPSGF